MDSVPESKGEAAASAAAEVAVEKRLHMVEIEVEGEVKRRKMNGENELKGVAEIVLVLSAMGRMRGGRDPTEAEKAMMAEARNKVVELCQGLAPKDILPKEAFGCVIQDLGLDRFREPRLGFRPSRLSIADKLAHAKRRMEESKAFATQSAPYPSQRLQNPGTSAESRVTPPNVRMFSSDNAVHLPVSAGSFQPPTPAVYPSSAVSTPLAFRPAGAEVRPPMVSSSVPNNTAVPPRVDRAHIKPDGRPNGPSLVSQIPVSSSTDQHMVRSTPVPLQPVPAQYANVGRKNKLPDQPVRADGNTGLSAPEKNVPAPIGQNAKQVASQMAPASLPAVRHPVQGIQFVHPSPVHHHIEISKLVQKLLDPKLPEHPAWTTPSRDYMNRAVGCQFCKVIINEVDNVLVCDACEKSYHLGCLQSYNAKGIPRGEWHCPRCLAMNRGKPFPPKYGRVTRNINTPKTSSNTAVFQSSSEKKTETLDNKVNQPSQITNGKPVLKAQAPDKTSETSSGSSLLPGNEIKGSVMSLMTAVNKEGKPNLGSHPINATGSAVGAFPSPATVTSVYEPPHLEVKVEVPPSNDRLVTETELRIPSVPHASSTSDSLLGSSNQNKVDHGRLSNGVEGQERQHGICNGVVECNKHDEQRHVKDIAQENVLVGERVQDRVGTMENGLHSVDWIGDADQVVDEKKFFQSCWINGVVYRVQDYALFRSGNGKVIPVKLQALWEDSQTSSKWLVVHKCYFPGDLPQEVGRPGAPQSNEVYESTHYSNVMAGFIQGKCEVLPFRKFGEERENQGSKANDSSKPVFIRNWFYDESKRAFRPNAS